VCTSTTRMNPAGRIRCCFMLSEPGGFARLFTTFSGTRPSPSRRASFWAGRSASGMTRLFLQAGETWGVVAWHQDYPTGPGQADGPSHLLDRPWTTAPKDNGCVHYVPGSHNWTLLPITGLAGNMDAIKEVLSPVQWEQFQHPVAIELKKGECSFHHPLMVPRQLRKPHRPSPPGHRHQRLSRRREKRQE